MSGAILQKIEETHIAFKEFRERNDSRLDELELRLNRENLGGIGPKLSNQEVNKTLRQWAKTGNEQVFHDLVPKIKNAMSVDDDPAGGYLVGSVMSPRIEEVMRDYVPMRGIARIETITEGDAFEEPWSERTGTESGWVGERESRPETDTEELKKHSYPLHEIYSNPKLTQKLLDTTTFNLEAWLGNRIGEEFADEENEAFVNGDGVLKPRGFLTHDISTDVDGTRSWGALQYKATGSSGDFGSPNPGDEIVDFVYSLKTAYRARARWVMNRLTAAELRKLKDGQGNYLWQQNFGEGEPERLLGFPVSLIDSMPDVAADSLSIAFGDFSRGYLIVDRPGIRVLRDPYTSKGWIFFYSTKRVGGDIADFHAIKLLKFGSS